MDLGGESNWSSDERKAGGEIPALVAERRDVMSAPEGEGLLLESS